MLQIYDVKLDVRKDEKALPFQILSKLHLDDRIWGVSDWKPVRKSLDARDKERLRWVYTVRFSLKRTDGKKVDEARILEQATSRKVKIEISAENNYSIPLIQGYDGPRPVIVGFGPCGIFAAYVLAKAGLCPIVLERGRSIEERAHHVEAYWKDGILREDSNVLFGEGGAGTFSDGKLTTGIGDARKTFVLETFSGLGGGDEILYLGKPHLGTDVLKSVVRNLRNAIISLGGEIRFGQKLTQICVDETGVLTKVISENTQAAAGAEAKDKTITEIETDDLVLAIGHSARDTAKALLEQGLIIEQKPFSMGVRIQHSQELIDRSQYGKEYDKKYGKLPAAEYKLSCKAADGRGVYTFCMCPGGEVVAAASEAGTICTNGMSERARDGQFSNSAILVDVRTTDFESSHPLAGMEFQRKVEEKAFAIRQELLETGNAYTPLAETVKEFSSEESILAKCLPSFITDGVTDALPIFGRKIAGFDDERAQLFGPETRSSSPIRILRDEHLQANIPGVYPCGEGAGYAGGIMSAAVDGIKAAEQIIRELTE
ncbi:MAG: NAD(FAD)-utilizing dehydrogenase [Clostridiales Family XIII bacterium]|jgi:uncharacterized FAD-dependent dehydrogenase|nr:NAD(FAD)-utilizing dehydrogenase [Clostridiales Family XIII bacterium]